MTKLILFIGLSWFIYDTGKTVERKAWLAREVTQITEANKKLTRLHEEARAKESLANVELNNIRDQLQEAQDEINNKDSIINKQYSDIASLRWDSTPLRASESEGGAVTAPTRECDGETITELSPEVFRYVYERFATCDEVVEQLTAAQEVITIDREFVNKLTE